MRKIGVTVLALVSLALAARVVTMYTVTNAWETYGESVRDYLARAVAHDSATLVARSTTAQPVAWVLHAVRAEPAVVGQWSKALRPVSGLRFGDTVLIRLTSRAGPCWENDWVTAKLIQTDKSYRMVSIQSPCIEENGNDS